MPHQIKAPSESLPVSCLHKGLHVKWEQLFTCGDGAFQTFWFKILDFDDEWIKAEALFDKPGCFVKVFEKPSHFGRVFKFRHHEVIGARGTMEWNIENLYVSCSERVLNGEPVGFFYRPVNFKARHFERHFFAMSEIPLDKYGIPRIEIPLKMLLELDNSIRPYLHHAAYYGVIKDGENFKALSQEDITDKSDRIFPCMFAGFRPSEFY
ncbi:MAG: hypothetical protein RQ761_10665 [Bacteroidales bacterium]|nr:hypothetical protein [Bacteroidales bacterium]